MHWAITNKILWQQMAVRAQAPLSPLVNKDSKNLWLDNYYMVPDGRYTGWNDHYMDKNGQYMKINATYRRKANPYIGSIIYTCEGCCGWHCQWGGPPRCWWPKQPLLFIATLTTRASLSCSLLLSILMNERVRRGVQYNAFTLRWMLCRGLSRMVGTISIATTKTSKTSIIGKIVHLQGSNGFIFEAKTIWKSIQLMINWNYKWTFIL
jgi:hypothetical protein